MIKCLLRRRGFTEARTQNKNLVTARQREYFSIVEHVRVDEEGSQSVRTAEPFRRLMKDEANAHAYNALGGRA